MTSLERVALAIYIRFPRSVKTSQEENTVFLKQSFKAAALFVSKQKPEEVLKEITATLRREDDAKVSLSEVFSDADAIDWAALGIEDED